MTISSCFQSFQERLVRLFSDYCFDYLFGFERHLMKIIPETHRAH
jgi:hypothetical protein